MQGLCKIVPKAKYLPRNKIREAIRKQLAYVRRDLGYLDLYLAEGYAPTKQEIGLIITIFKLKQAYMYINKVHSVEHRIVSIKQPWIR
jgi:hypothetical protein